MLPAVCSLRARAVRPCASQFGHLNRQLAPSVRKCRRAGAAGRRQARPAALLDFVDLIEPFVRLSESIADGSILEPASLRAIGINSLEAGALYSAYSLAVRVRNQLDEQRLQVEAGGAPPPRKFLGVGWGGGDDSDSEGEEGDESGDGRRADEDAGLVFDIGLISLIMWFFITGVLFYTGWFYDAFTTMSIGASVFMKMPIPIVLGLALLMLMGAFELENYGVDILAMSLGTNVVGAFKRYSEGRKITSAGPKTVRALSSAVITAGRSTAVH